MTLKIVLIVWYLQSFCLQASFANTLEREVVKAERQRAAGNTNESAGPFTDIVITISIKCNKIIEQHARWNSRGVLFSSLYVLSTSAFQHFQVWVKMRKRRPCSDHYKAEFVHFKQLLYSVSLCLLSHLVHFHYYFFEYLFLVPLPLCCLLRFQFTNIRCLYCPISP